MVPGKLHALVVVDGFDAHDGELCRVVELRIRDGHEPATKLVAEDASQLPRLHPCRGVVDLVPPHPERLAEDLGVHLLGRVPGGGGGLRCGGSNAIAKSCGKLRENCGKLWEFAGKLRKNGDVVSGPPEPSRCKSSGEVAHNCQNFTETNSPWSVQLQEAPLDITMELQHEPNYQLSYVRI